MHYVIIFSRVFLGLVFLWSAASKVWPSAAFRSFRRTVGHVAPWLRRRSAPFAVLAVMAEAVVVVTLTVPATVGVGFALATLLLLAFTAGLLGVLRRGANVACHCFGDGDEPVAPRHVVRNAALLLTAVAGLAAWLTAPDGGVVTAAGLLVAGGLAVVLTLLTVALEDLTALGRPADVRAPR